MKLILFIFIYLIGFGVNISFSQVFQDSFSDGNFSFDPSWLGDTEKFVVNANDELQLNDLGNTGEAYLYTDLRIQDSCVWDFNARLDLSTSGPSASNNIQVCLQTDRSNLSGPLSGYFLKIGENGSNDAIELIRQDEEIETVIFRSQDGLVANSPLDLHIRVHRNHNSLWELYVDYEGGNNFTLEGSVVDSTYKGGEFFGIVCKYTSTQGNRLYFDNFSIGPLYIDSIAPQLDSIYLLSSREVCLDFDEPLDPWSAQELENYDINNDVLLEGARLDSNDWSRVCLDVNYLERDIEYRIQIQNLKDIDGNRTNTILRNFIFIPIEEANRYDIILNEVFPDYSPSLGLPEAEFVELYNRSQKTINLEGYTLSDANNRSQAFPPYLLAPNNFLILCSSSAYEEYSNFGSSLALESFPNLNIEEESVYLYDANNTIIDGLTYVQSWYDPKERGAGGWSLERISSDILCTSVNNWAASENLLGGSPGFINSIASPQEDDQGPKLKRIFPIDAYTLRLFFSEALEDSTIISLSSYDIYPEIEILGAHVETPEYNTVILELEEALDNQTIYELRIHDNIRDCVGNIIREDNSALFGLAEEIQAGDILISEILFNPYPEESDFVEIYNNSDKLLNLSDLVLAREDAFSLQIEQVQTIDMDYLLLPKMYIAFSEKEEETEERYQSKHPEYILEQELPNFPDDEGKVILYTVRPNQNIVIDEFGYSEDLHHPFLQDKEGVSLERINFNTSSQEMDNWHSAASTVYYASPGYKNSQQSVSGSQTTEILDLPNKRFSPDGDGYEDYLLLHYQLEQTGWLAHIRIFDANGRLIRQLKNGDMLMMEGVIQWDGQNDLGKQAKPGIYIVQAELIHPNGQVLREKKSCILAKFLD